MDFTDDTDTTPIASVEAGFPDPDEATEADVAEYTEAWMRKNPRAAAKSYDGSDDDPAVELPYSKSIDEDGTKFKSEFPWLHDPAKGVRWDFDPIELRVLAQENPWVGMLVQSITKEISETSWTITEADDPTETQKRLATHPESRAPIAKELPDEQAADIYNLLMDPAPDYDWYDAVEMWMADLLEVGSMTGVKAFPTSAYDADDNLAVDPAALTPQHILPSAPEVWTKAYPDKSGIRDGYWQFDNHSAPGASSARTRGVGQPIHFDRQEVIWSDMAPRSNRRYGMPPTLLVQDFLQSLDLAVAQEQQYLSRGSIPSGAWVFEEYDMEQMKDIRSEFSENVKGKPHKSLFLGGQGGDVKFEPMSMNFKELEFTERMRWYARVVASAFQVPTAVVGIEPEKVNYATFQGERENFESNTLGPYLQQLERIINSQIIQPHWGDDYRFEFTPGMSESTREMIMNRVKGGFDANILRRNEARRELGREAVDEAEDGFKDDVVEDSGDDGPFGNVTMSVEKEEDDADFSKAEDEPLRNTDDWGMFDVQPGEIEALHDEIAADVGELYDRILSDEEVQRLIDQFAESDGSEPTEKSLTGLSRRIQELLSDSDVAERIREAVDSARQSEIQDAIADAAAQEDADIDIDPIMESVVEREVPFADRMVDRVSEEVRETVAEGWQEGKNSLEIRDDIAEVADSAEGWGTERIARQELQLAAGEARNAYADETNRVEVWRTSDDGRVREPHANMDGLWKRPSENFEVDYSSVDRGVQTEKVPGDSEPGIGCRCFTELVDIDAVDPDDHVGV